MVVEFVSEQPAVVSVTVSSDVTSRAVLAKLFVSSLGFPSWHTGKSWDATFDWMTDFGWLDEGATVVISHPSLPLLGTRDLRLYLSVLADSVKSWESNPAITFRVVFAESLRSEVLESLRVSSY